MGRDKEKKPKSGPPAHKPGGPAGFGQSQQSSQLIAQQTVSAFTGPIPPAELLQRYNQVMPGVAETIVGWNSQEIKHRHEQENGMLGIDWHNARATAGDSRLGLWLGFAVSVILLSVSLVLALKDQPWAAVSLGGGTLVGLVGTFVYGSRKMRAAPVPSSTAAPPNQNTQVE